MIIEQRVRKRKPVFVDVRFAESEFPCDPGILVITIAILSGAQRVRHSFNAVHYRAREIVCRIDPNRIDNKFLSLNYMSVAK